MRSMLSRDSTTILPLLHPTVSKRNAVGVVFGVFVRAERELSVISESKRISQRGKKAMKVGVWLRE